MSDTTQFEAAVTEDLEGTFTDSYSIGGKEWVFLFPIPAILVWPCIKDGQSLWNLQAALDLLESTIIENQRDEFLERLRTRPAIETPELLDLVSWCIGKTAGRPLESAK